MILDWKTKLTLTTNLQRTLWMFKELHRKLPLSMQNSSWSYDQSNYLLSNCRWILSTNRNIRVSHIWYRARHLLKLILKLHEVFFQTHKTLLKTFTWSEKKLFLIFNKEHRPNKENESLVLPSSTSLSRSEGSSFPFIFLATLFLSSRIPSTSCYLQALISWTKRRKINVWIQFLNQCHQNTRWLNTIQKLTKTQSLASPPIQSRRLYMFPLPKVPTLNWA